jgi:hypothetical protein
MEENINLRKILGLFTDEERFKVLEAVALGAGTVERITAMTGMNNPAITKALVKLEGVGLVGKRRGGYVFRIEVLRDLNKSLGQETGKKPKESGLERFMRDGKITTYPKLSEDKLLVLSHLAGLFEYNREYPEKEVNEMLKTVNPDFASYRRYLIDAGVMEREHVTGKDGRNTIIYRRIKHL